MQSSLFLTLLAFLWPFVAEPTIQEVYLVSAPYGATCFSPTSKTIDADGGELAVVVVSEGQHFAAVELCEEKSHLWQGESPEIYWYRVEPQARGIYFDNMRPSFHWDDIPFVETLFARHLWQVPVDVSPTITEARAPTLGTMRFSVWVVHHGKVHRAAGGEERWRGAVGEAVHRVSVRANTGHPLIDAAFARFNLPYIWGSAGLGDADHQTERWIGADCADFITGAFRDIGGQAPYAAAAAFHPRGEYVQQGFGQMITGWLELGANGMAETTKRQPVRFGSHPEGVTTGDVLVYEQHVALLYADRSPEGHANGYLDEQDLILHTLYREPTVEPLGTAHPQRRFLVFRFHGVTGKYLRVEDIPPRYLPPMPTQRSRRDR